MMNPPTDMGRDQIAREIQQAAHTAGLTPYTWDELTESTRQDHLQVADALMARTVVLARTHHGEATALDYTQGAIAEAMTQATQHAGEALGRAHEMGTAVYYGPSVTADETTLVQMIGQAYVTGHRAAASAACGALDDIARLQADVDERTRFKDEVKKIVADAKARAADGNAVMVELPEETPSFRMLDAAFLESGGITLCNHARAEIKLDVDEARSLVPQMLALIRDHDQAAADARHSRVIDFAQRLHADPARCDGTQDDVADCPRCMDIAETAVAHFTPADAA